MRIFLHKTAHVRMQVFHRVLFKTGPSTRQQNITNVKVFITFCNSERSMYLDGMVIDDSNASYLPL